MTASTIARPTPFVPPATARLTMFENEIVLFFFGENRLQLREMWRENGLDVMRWEKNTAKDAVPFYNLDREHWMMWVSRSGLQALDHGEVKIPKFHFHHDSFWSNPNKLCQLPTNSSNMPIIGQNTGPIHSDMLPAASKCLAFGSIIELLVREHS